MTRAIIARRLRRTPPAGFKPLSLTEMLLGFLGRRHRKSPEPINPDWENDAPMTGLS